MIPILDTDRTTDALHRSFLDALKATGFGGEIRLDFASRLTASTDNSVYQIVPQAVLLPRSASDVVAIARTAAEPRYRTVSITPRGAGTGTNGGSLGTGLSLDLSKHMNQIIDLDLKAETVTVQPGVVLDQLNTYLRPHGYFFAPHVATADRATLGGMIANDSCGKGSRLFGRTSRHVVSLQLVLLDGSRWQTRRLTEAELDTDEDLPAAIRRGARAVRDAVRDEGESLDQLPQLDRFFTGYNLAQSFDGRHIDLNPLLCGSEGTLALVTEAVLQLTKLPRHSQLVVAAYGSFDDALADAERLLEAAPAAVETIDETLLDLARNDLVWRQVAHHLDESSTRALHLIELCSDERADLDARAEILRDQILSGTAHRAILAAEQEAPAFWSLRSKGAGLLGSMPGNRRPVAFVEDCAVPPARLPDFVRDFRALLDQHGLRYGIYGHADVGCLHVRPALDMRQAEDAALLRTLTDGVFALVESYGGVLWGEHGKGLRSEYSPQMLGPALYQQMRRVKEAFDPHHQLNPGKVATPASSNARLAPLESTTRGDFDRQITPAAQKAWEGAIACNGNGACFSWKPDQPMCPSAKATGDRIHSPKGRATVIREWLRQLSEAGFDPVTGMAPHGTSTSASQVRTNDFSHEVYDAMEGCLACKACVAECPIHVDIPSFKARFLDLYHQRYPRSAGDRAIAALETSLPALHPFARWINRATQLPLARRSLARLLGLSPPPALSRRAAVATIADGGGNVRSSPNQGARPDSSPTRGSRIVLLPDAFTNFFEPAPFLAMYRLAALCAEQVAILPYQASGKSMHIAGMLDDFRACARRNRDRLEPWLTNGYQVVAVEPAIALLYRQEYADLPAVGAIDVRLPQEWLLENLSGRRSTDPQTYVLFSHCTEGTTAAAANALWADLFAACGLALEVPALGCCGMAGAYGYRTKHAADSAAIFASSWQEHLRRVAPQRVLATGHSCRTQVARMAGFTPRHPLEVLADALVPKPPETLPDKLAERTAAVSGRGV